MVQYGRIPYKYLNLKQTQKERSDKYAYCRDKGATASQANRMRDWHWFAINDYFDLPRAYRLTN